MKGTFQTMGILEDKRASCNNQAPHQDLEFLLEQTDPVDTVNEGDTVVFFSTRNHPHYNYLYPLFSHLLTRMDVPCYYFFFHHQISRTYPDLTLQNIQVSNALRVQEHPYLFRSGQIGYPRFHWEVDLEKERIVLDGLPEINFFPVFRATIQKDLRRYNLDFSDPDVARAVQRGLFTADEVLRYCQLLTNYARKKNLQIKIMGWEKNYIPHGFFYLYSLSEYGRDYIDYVHLGTMYGHYFGSVEDFGRRIGICNETKRNIFNKFAGFREEFDAYRNQILGDDEKRKSVRDEVLHDLRHKILGHPNAAVNLSESESKKLKNRIEETKQAGHRVYTLFTHKFFDVGLYDDSDCFDDMCQWIDRTVDFFRDRQDLLILKPHPAEVDEKNPTNEPRVTLEDYLGGEPEPDNILLLGPTDLRSLAVYQEADCGLIWRSSVALEMGTLGIPMIIAGRPYYLDYLDLPVARSETKYYDMIVESAGIEIDKQCKTSCAIFLHFFKNERHTEIEYIRNVDYSALKPFDIQWDRERLETLLEEGDEELEEMLQELWVGNRESSTRSFLRAV